MSEPMPLLLAMAFRLLADRLHEHLADEGQPEIRPAHGFTIGYLATTGGATAVDLAAYLGVTKQGAAHITGELERWGYVEQVRHPTDGRSRLIVATAKGHSLLDRVRGFWAAEEERWAELVGAERIGDARVALEALIGTAGREQVAVRPTW